MHSSQSRTAGQAVSRGRSRSWFVSVEGWIYDGYVDVEGEGRADGRKISSSAARPQKRRSESGTTLVIKSEDYKKPVPIDYLGRKTRQRVSTEDRRTKVRNVDASSRNRRFVNARKGCVGECVAIVGGRFRCL
ncbi:uncharacterized protein B0H18DRAFT_1123456 [Fomitopsis serialis]|uniref:uncharacterized protein n=1 Tax=Fomitopsis serialis TaxID=139415 RepID=UPI0020082AAC|nr:uncharacterized protein B0H18DRAFT_1123456 [Neoantrodia serialis]KAH9917750.1 hypothetical protein B0H18DRAFT_1123456 [Neoantrodia serialis]